jgi:HSP20 family molecular chaperone IbpA
MPMLRFAIRANGKGYSMISNGKPDKHSRRGLVEQIRQLEEKVRTLGEGGAKSKPDSEGLAQGIVIALGRMVPGLEGLIKIASQMPDFQQRLGAIDEEVKRRFKEQPLRQAAAGLAGGHGHHRIGIPPSVRRSGTHGPDGRATAVRSGSTGMGQGQFTPKTPARGKYRQPGPPKVHISPQTPAKLTVDIFDEGPRIVLLAEAPGLSAADITISLEGTVLLISIHAPSRNVLQRVELPCEVAGHPQVSLQNGILNIQIEKVNKQ